MACSAGIGLRRSGRWGRGCWRAGSAAIVRAGSGKVPSCGRPGA
ncbi:hypothetical protein STRNTR1_0250 [Stenotrophomonas maltophilia]|nr:hypothetical protein STRNTR1_0250 [Stenotrophomonas maltophilia]